MRTLIKKWLGRALGKSGPPVVAIFLSGDEARSRAMAQQMWELVPDHPHIVIAREGTDLAAFTYFEDIILVNPSRPFDCWWKLRRRLGRRWIALAPFLWEGGGPLRWMPWLLAPRKLLAFNGHLERHHVRLSAPIASWRFLRGEPVGDIFRPTPLAGLKKIPALVGFPVLLACWAAVQIRRGGVTPLPAGAKPEPGVAVLEAGSSDELDEAVARTGCDRVLVGRAELAPELEKCLEQPGVWLAYAGRKTSLAGGLPAPGEMKIGEQGTWALCHQEAAFLFRRDVYLELGGAARVEKEHPGAALAALSLLGWQRGYRTLFAGKAERSGDGGTSPERLILGTISDFRTAVNILWGWSWQWRRVRAAVAALGVRATPPPRGRAHRGFVPLLDPGVHVFRGRAPSHARRVAVVSPYLPFPLSHGGAIRIFNLLRAAAEETDIYLFAFGEKETGREVEPLLEFCSRVVLIETPRWEPSALIRILPRGVARFRSPAMRAAVTTVVRDEQIPIVQVEYTQLAHLRSISKLTPVRTVLVEHDITFDLHRQLRLRERGWAKLRAQLEEARWRRYELHHAARFDRVIAMSEQDRDRLVRDGLHSGRVAVVENGVDLERFRAAPPAEGSSYELLFVGSFRHFPNIDGFRFLVEKVRPILRNWRPELKLTVVAGADHRYYWRLRTGADPPEYLGEIEMLDFVEDVRPLYRRATVVVVPLVVSAGTNIKVLEALAMGRAVVSTTVGVAGLGLTSGQNVLLADSPDAFAAAILGLLSNDQAREEIAARGRAFVEERYDWNLLAKKLVTLWESEIAGSHAEIAAPIDGRD